MDLTRKMSVDILSAFDTNNERLPKIIDECINKFGDSGYLFSNMIAKFISSSDEYYISKNALIKLAAKNYDKDKIYKRSFLARLPEFFLEHSVPVSLIREKLLSINSNIDEFFLIIK